MTAQLTLAAKTRCQWGWETVTVTHYISPKLPGLRIDHYGPLAWHIYQTVSERRVGVARNRKEATRMAEFLAQHYDHTTPYAEDEDTRDWLYDLHYRAFRVARGEPDPGEWSDDAVSQL